MNLQHYILVDRKPVACTLMEWADFFEVHANRVVKQDTIDGVFISTVFLGLDHGWGQSEEPIVFETMILDGKFDEYQTRCATWDEAEKMHRTAVNEVKQYLKAV